MRSAGTVHVQYSIILESLFRRVFGKRGAPKPQRSSYFFFHAKLSYACRVVEILDFGRTDENFVGGGRRRPRMKF